MAIGIVVAGIWSDRTSPRKVLAIGCVGTVMVGGLLAPMLGAGSGLLVWGFLSLALLAMGFVYGRSAPSYPACFRRWCAIPGSRFPSMSAESWAAGWRRCWPRAWPPMGNLAYIGVYLSGAAAISLGALAMVGKRA